MSVRLVEQTPGVTVLSNALIVEQTPDKTVLKVQKRFRWISFLLLLPLAGIASIAVIGTDVLGAGTEVRCQRVEPKQVNCQSTWVRFFGLVRQESRSLRSVTAVRIANDSSDASRGLVYLESRMGSTYFSNDLERAREVSAFLKSPTKEHFESFSIEVSLVPATMKKLTPVLVNFAIACGIVVFASIVNLTDARLYTFDKRKQEITAYRHVLSRKVREARWPLSVLVAELKLQTLPRNDDDSCCEVELKLPRQKDGIWQKDSVLHVISNEPEPVRAAYDRV